MKRIMVTILLFAAAAAAMAAGRAEEAEKPAVFVDVSETVSAPGSGTVTLETSVGEARIVGWERDQVEVTGRVGEDIAGVMVVPDLGGIRVSVQLPDRENMANLAIESFLTIHVPIESAVVALGLGSAITVSGVSGVVDVRTAIGDVSVAGPLEKVSVQTVGGDVTITGPVVHVEFETTTGDVSVTGLEGSVAGSTMDGSIRIEGPRLERVQLSTLTGDITIAGTPTSDALIRTVARIGGSVDLTLPPDVQGLFTLSGGSLDMDAFTPDHPVEWVYGEPGEDDARSAADGRFAVTVVRPPDPERGERTSSEAQWLDLDVRVPGIGSLLGTSREFRLGSGTVRVIIEAGGLLAFRDGDDGGHVPGIVLRTGP